MQENLSQNSSLPRPSLEELTHLYSGELKKIQVFLSPLEPLWSLEVLNEYPRTMPSLKKEWLEAIDEWTMEMEWKTDCGEDFDKLPDSSLKELFLHLQELEDIKRWPETQEIKYPSWATFKVGGKKIHEIQRIIPLLSTLELGPGDHFVDIGGGKGHLSRILCLYHGLNGVTLDTNQEFQNLGKARLEKYQAPEGAGKLTFALHTFGGNDCKEREQGFFKEAKGSFGLHTCGPLALHHLSKVERSKALLNFGCCYQKMSPGKDTLLSQYAREVAPVNFTKHALTLASRGHTSISLSDYELKKKVKKMRSALHFFMIEKEFESGFVTVGSAHPRIYHLSFEDYAITKLKELGHDFNEEKIKIELSEFWNRPELQKILQEIYRANIVRWRFGRILEKYLLFDRALSYVEKGHPVEVYQFFDESLSPRNIGLLKRP